MARCKAICLVYCSRSQYCVAYCTAVAYCNVVLLITLLWFNVKWLIVMKSGLVQFCIACGIAMQQVALLCDLSKLWLTLT